MYFQHILYCCIEIPTTGGIALASTGSIIVNAYTSNAQIPVEGTTVLFRQQNPPYSMLGLRITDSSGKTEPLTVDTVDPMLSQSPAPPQRPWTGLILQVEHPEYERVVLDGVQIFPGIITVQDVSLLPMQRADAEKEQQQDFNFTPQPISEGT